MLIDAVDNIHQLHDGAIEQVEMAFERANRFGAPSANYATFAALEAATIANGAYATCLAEGMIRTSAPTEQPLAFHIKGDKPGAGARSRLPGAIIARIAAIAGAPAISTASLSALDTARPWPLSIDLTEQTTAREVIQSIAASVNAVAGISWTGSLWARPIGIGSPSLALDAAGKALPPVASVQQMPVAAPWSVLAIESERTWLVHALSDIAFTAPLTPRGAYDPATVYREGDIVGLPEGSQWLFIATTPTGGVTPSLAASTTWAPYGDAVSANWSDIIDDDGNKPTDNADETAANAPSVTGAATIAIAADYLSVTTTILPIPRRLIAMIGTTDVSSTTSFVVGTLPGGIAATINNTGGSADRGVLSLTQADASGSIPVTVTFANGYSTTVLFTVTRTKADPPSSGGSGATTVTDSISQPGSTSHAFLTGELTVRSTAGGTLRFSASADYSNYGAGLANMAIKPAYKLVGAGSYTDAQSETTGVGAVNGVDGYVSIAEFQVSGMAASTDYNVVLYGRRTSGNSPYVNFGSFTVRQ